MIIDLHAEITGDDSLPPFLILHGLFGSSSNWRSIARRLADRYRVVCLDLRNHGSSPWSEEMTYFDLAGDVVHFIEKHGIENPVVLGHSMGGKTLMTMMQEFDAAIDLAFVIDISPVAYEHNHDNLVKAMQAVDFAVVDSRKAIDAQLEESIPEASLRQFLMQNLRMREGKLSWRINLKSIMNNMEYIFEYNSNSVVNSAIVFVAGGQSDYIQPAHTETILSYFPNAKIEVVDNAGHWLHAEQPGALMDILNKFLEISPPAG